MMNWNDVIQLSREIVSVVNRLSNCLRTTAEVSQTLYRGVLPTANTDPVYTVRPQTKLILREIVLCNTSGGALTFNISFADPGAAESTAGRIYDTVSIASKETLVLPCNTLLNAEERVYAWASGSGVNARISALEITAL